jgi:hypothetical protein
MLAEHDLSQFGLDMILADQPSAQRLDQFARLVEDGRA